MATGDTTAPPRRLVKKRIYIPAILLGLLLAVFVWLYIRGTSADSTERNPSTSADDVVPQLHTDAAGHTAVRCALVVDAPIAAVWAVVTDYDKQGDFLPYVGSMSGTPEGDGKFHIKGVAHSRLWGDWPFDSHVKEREDPDDSKKTVSWEETDAGELAVNRGRWELRKLPGDKTLLIYVLQVETKHYPNFLVRNIIMDRLPTVVRAVAAEVQKRGK